jgi:hypothetical protein
LSRGGRRIDDVIDAAAAAGVAAFPGEAALLVERGDDRGTQRTRLINQPALLQCKT